MLETYLQDRYKQPHKQIPALRDKETKIQNNNRKRTAVSLDG
jgi:hypothetical protein